MGVPPAGVDMGAVELGKTTTSMAAQAAHDKHVTASAAKRNASRTANVSVQKKSTIDFRL
jgi:hypothetical protein